MCLPFAEGLTLPPMPGRRATDSEKRAAGTFTPARSWKRRGVDRALIEPGRSKAPRSPKAPRDLAEHLRPFWKRYVRAIAKRRPLDATDVPGLVNFCLLAVELEGAQCAGTVSRALMAAWNAATRRYGLDRPAPKVNPVHLSPPAVPRDSNASEIPPSPALGATVLAIARDLDARFGPRVKPQPQAAKADATVTGLHPEE
jgi:hypothetical protein